MKYFLFGIIFFTINFSFAQKISNVDYDLIQKEIKDSSSFYYYPRMIELFNNNISLTSEEYIFLYYGNVYYQNYNPYGYDSKDFKNLVREAKYQEAIPLGKELLSVNPIDLDLLYNMLICYHYLDIKDTAKIYGSKYFTFIDVIISSGDGKSVKTAYVVNCVSDEYNVLRELELKAKGQALLSDGPTDLLYIDTKGQKKVKGQKKIKEVYFNISKYWDATTEMFKKEFKETEEKNNENKNDTLKTE